MLGKWALSYSVYYKSETASAFSPFSPFSPTLMFGDYSENLRLAQDGF